MGVRSCSVSCPVVTSVVSCVCSTAGCGSGRYSSSAVIKSVSPPKTATVRRFSPANPASTRRFSGCRHGGGGVSASSRTSLVSFVSCSFCFPFPLRFLPSVRVDPLCRVRLTHFTRAAIVASRRRGAFGSGGERGLGIPGSDSLEDLSSTISSSGPTVQKIHRYGLPLLARPLALPALWSSEVFPWQSAQVS